MIKADLHIHSKEDIVDSIDYTSYQLIDRAAELDFGLISITLHDYFPDYSKIEEYANKRNIVFFPGVEKVISGKEVLLYNLSRQDFEALKTFDDLRRIKSQKKDLLVIAPHPYFKIDKCLEDDLERNLDLFDAIEFSWFYSRHINFNKKAVNIGKKFSKPLFANSDAHSLDKFGKYYTLIDSKREKSSIIDAIKKGKVILHSEPMPSIVMLGNAVKILTGGVIKKFRTLK